MKKSRLLGIWKSKLPICLLLFFFFFFPLALVFFNGGESSAVTRLLQIFIGSICRFVQKKFTPRVPIWWKQITVNKLSSSGYDLAKTKPLLPVMVLKMLILWAPKGFGGFKHFLILKKNIRFSAFAFKEYF